MVEEHRRPIIIIIIISIFIRTHLRYNRQLNNSTYIKIKKCNKVCKIILRAISLE